MQQISLLQLAKQCQVNLHNSLTLIDMNNNLLYFVTVSRQSPFLFCYTENDKTYQKRKKTLEDKLVKIAGTTYWKLPEVVSIPS